MSLISDIQGARSCRPYPIDHERRRRVLVALAEKDLTISSLARRINVAQSIVSQVINGRRISPVTEQKIAAFLKKKTDYLFPRFTTEYIRQILKVTPKHKSRKRKVS